MNTKNSIPILTSIKSDTGAILNALSSGVTRIAASVKTAVTPAAEARRDRAAAARTRRRRVADQSGRRTAPADNTKPTRQRRERAVNKTPKAEVMVKLEDAGKTFVEKTGASVKAGGGKRAVKIGRKAAARLPAGGIDSAASVPAAGAGQDKNPIQQAAAVATPINAAPRAARPVKPKDPEAVARAEERKRDGQGRFLSAGQRAFEAGRGRNADKDRAETNSLLSRLLGASEEMAKNSDVKEAVGLATVGGPVTEAVSEIARFGGSVKDSMANAIDKMRGDQSDRPDETAVAQLEVETETLDTAKAIQTAIEGNEDDQADRDEKIIKALRGVSGGSGKGGLLGGLTGGGLKGFLGSALKNTLAIGGAAAVGWTAGTWINDQITKALGNVSLGERLFDWLHGIKTKDRPGEKNEISEIAKVLKGAADLEKELTQSVADMIMGVSHVSAGPAGGSSPGKKETVEETVGRIRGEAREYKDRYSIDKVNKAAKGIYTDKAISPNQQHTGIGALSARYESGGRADSVSKDVGGMAYGTYQMHSGGTVGTFINNSKWAGEFAGLKPGSKEYGDKWKEVAARDGGEFADAQHEFIKQTHYAPMVARAEKLGLDVSNNKMLQDVLWSTGVQHGAGGGPEILSKALAGADPKTLTPTQIADRIYAERGRTDINGNLVHFSKVRDASGKQSLLNRFQDEALDAHAMAWSKDNTTPEAQPKPMATIIPPEAPAAVPIVKQQVPPQQVVVTNPGGATAAPAPAGGTGSFSGPQIDRRPNPPRQKSQPGKENSNIPMEFDDVFLTLMAHDLI